LTSFGSYKATASRWITFIDSEFYPDYLDEAKVLYGSVLQEFTQMAGVAQNSADLLRNISQKPNPSRTQLLRVFRKYVSPDTQGERDRTPQT